MVFQDPYGALDPLHTVEYTVMRPWQNFLNMSATQARQRGVLARALACDPGLIVADEPVCNTRSTATRSSYSTR